MMGGPRPVGNDPRRYTSPIKFKLRELVSQMHDDIDRVDDAQAKELLEVSAEVVSSLIQAFEDYEVKNEAALR